MTLITLTPQNLFLYHIINFYTFLVHIISVVLISLAIFTVFSIIQFSRTTLLSQQASHIFDQGAFWLSTLLLFSILSPGLYWLYAGPELAIRSIEGTLVTVGRMWYWTFESNINQQGLNSLQWDSYGLEGSQLALGGAYLSESDRPIIFNSNIIRLKVITHDADVIHSWEVPSLGVKIDCVPGQCSGVPFYIPSQGIIVGRCYELCDISHARIQFNILCSYDRTSIN